MASGPCTRWCGHQRQVEDRELLAGPQSASRVRRTPRPARSPTRRSCGDARPGEVVGYSQPLVATRWAPSATCWAWYGRPAHAVTQPRPGVRPGQVVEQEPQPLHGPLPGGTAGSPELVRPVDADRGDAERRVLLGSATAPSCGPGRRPRGMPTEFRPQARKRLSTSGDSPRASATGRR